MKTALSKQRIEDLVNSGYKGPVLVPVMDDLDSLPYGECMADIHKNRNPGNHRRFFAFINQAFDMQEHYEEQEVFRKVLQLKAGFFDEVIGDKGNIIYLPRSIAWDKLDETEFKELFTKVVNAFIRDFGDKLNEIQINSIIEF